MDIITLRVHIDDYRQQLGFLTMEQRGQLLTRIFGAGSEQELKTDPIVELLYSTTRIIKTLYNVEQPDSEEKQSRLHQVKQKAKKDGMLAGDGYADHVARTALREYPCKMESMARIPMLSMHITNGTDKIIRRSK